MAAVEKRTILIVDDDITALDIVEYLFEDQGFEVIRRTDGQSAIDCIDEIMPDILLIDLMMPGVSGQDTIRQLRSSGYEGPIIAFTALDDPDVHDEARQAGCNLVLTKPCKPRDLVGHIKDFLD